MDQDIDDDTLALFKKSPMDIYVGNLADNANPRNLRVLFQQYGEVHKVSVQNKYGFVVSFVHISSS